MGTMLQQTGLPLEACPEAWNLERPAAVRAVHAAYRDAGAELLQTNSFGGNRFRLQHAGLADRVPAIHRAAVQLAREGGGAAGLLIAGSIGPAAAWQQRCRAPEYRQPARFALEAAFAEQAAALADAGVDLFLIETMTDVAEALIALSAARTQAPLAVAITLVFGQDHRTRDGKSPAEAAGLLAEAGAAAVGANCLSPAALLPILTAMRAAHPGIPLIAQPSAGLPRLSNGAPVYPFSPAAMGRWARRLAAAGADLIGGCCGTTSAHVGAIRKALHRPGSLSGSTPSVPPRCQKPA